MSIHSFENRKTYWKYFTNTIILFCIFYFFVGTRVVIYPLELLRLSIKSYVKLYVLWIGNRYFVFGSNLFYHHCCYHWYYQNVCLFFCLTIIQYCRIKYKRRNETLISTDGWGNIMPDPLVRYIPWSSFGKLNARGGKFDWQ